MVLNMPNTPIKFGYPRAEAIHVIYINEKYNHSYKLHCLYPMGMMFSTPTRDHYDYARCVCLFGTLEQPVVDISEFDRARSRNVQL